MTHTQTKSLSGFAYDDKQKHQADKAIITYSVSDLKSSLETINCSLEGQRSLVEEARIKLAELEEELSKVKLMNHNQIHAKIDCLQQSVNIKKDKINILNIQLEEANNKVNNAERQKGSIREDAYKYTEWHYTNWWEGGGRQWLIARFPGHHLKDWLNAYDFRIEVDRVDITLGYPTPYFRQIEPNFTKLIFDTNFIHQFYACGVYAVQHISLYHGTDRSYSQHIQEAHENLNEERARKNDIEAQIKGLKKEIKKKEGQKVGFEQELQRVKEDLRAVLVEKEWVEVKLKELLQEQKNLEVRRLEIEKLVNKEEIKATQESQVAKTVLEAEEVKLAEAALRQAIGRTKEQEATEEDRKNLGLRIAEYSKFSLKGRDNMLLSEAQHLEEELGFKSIDDDCQTENVQDHETSEDDFVYVTGINSYGW